MATVNGGSASRFIERHEKEIRSLCNEFGEDHPSVAEAWNSLGLYYHFATNDAERSLNCHRKALQVLQRALHKATTRVGFPASDESATNSECMCSSKYISDLSRSIAVTNTDIGTVLWKKGDLKLAWRHYDRAMHIFQSLGLKSNDLRVDATLRNIQLIDPSYCFMGTCPQENRRFASARRQHQAQQTRPT